MIKYEGTEIQLEALRQAKIVKFYNGKTPPVYIINCDFVKAANDLSRKNISFEYECLTIKEYEELMK